MLKSGNRHRLREPLAVTAAYGTHGEENKARFHVHKAWVAQLRTGDLVRFQPEMPVGGSMWSKTWRVERVGGTVGSSGELYEVHVREVQDW